MAQLELFSAVAGAYAEAGSRALSNTELYERLSEAGVLDRSALEQRRCIGRGGAQHSPLKRKLRWYQQTLKHMGIIDRVEGERGRWRLRPAADKKPTVATPGTRLVAFSTELGVAIWGDSQALLPSLDQPITLCVTSPPYPLQSARRYGNPDAHAFVDFLCSALEPVVAQLVDGGSIVLNLSNDIFESKSPARSLYLERTTLALHDRLGLYLMDRIPWVNLSKPPSPTYWACRERVQLCAGWEPVLWLTNNPARVRSDNRRVLEAHNARHAQLLAAGGEQRTAQYGDGAYRLRPGSFGAKTAGRIPKNVYIRGHACADTRAYRGHAAREDLMTHGAVFPTDLPGFFIDLLTEPDELVVDLFGGTARSGLAAQRRARRWLVIERVLDYMAGARHLFSDAAGYSEASWLKAALP